MQTDRRQNGMNGWICCDLSFKYFILIEMTLWVKRKDKNSEQNNYECKTPPIFYESHWAC